MTVTFPGINDAFQRDVLTVAQLNQSVGELLERHVPVLWVRGEISNFMQAASGHWYFTLKDSRAAVKVVMFRSRASSVGFVPKPGDEVEVRARVSLYEPRGDYQLQADAMRRGGLGNLYEAFMRLKTQLASEGLFDESVKRTPVALPRAIGVVTSLHAAALRDVLSALARRAPQVPVIVYPAPVQGADAAMKLAQQVVLANERNEVDTLLVVRGGGSLEDLWSFNDESLARAIAASAIPVISGVGHETDFTIVDFVADVRAPTPTAAAELACVPRADLLDRIGYAAQRLHRVQERRLSQATQRFDRAVALLVSPARRLEHQAERLNGLRHRLAAAWQAPQSRRTARLDRVSQRLPYALPDTERSKDRVSALMNRLKQAQARQLGTLQARTTAISAHLRALNPQHTLARGYAIVRDEQGEIVRDTTRLSSGDTLDVTFAQGNAAVQVVRTSDS